MVGLLAILVMSCAADQPPEVTRPGTVLVDRDARRVALAAMPPAQRDAWCAVPAGLGDPAPVAAPAGPAPTGRTMPASRSLWTSCWVPPPRSRATAAAAASLARLLKRWAGANALTRIEQPTANTYYALDRCCCRRSSPSPSSGTIRRWSRAARERVRAWLERLVEARRPPRADEVTARNNHHYLRGSVDAAWGALVGDDARFRGGLAAYRDAIAAMRPDGSLPLETRRGARALWYQRHAIASLVVIAEIAAAQGVDLYGYGVDGRDLHLGIRFLLDGIDVPSRVWPYAAANEKPGPQPDYTTQDLGFLDAARPRAALHGLGRDLRGPLPPTPREPAAAGAARASRAGLPPDDRRL